MPNNIPQINGNEIAELFASSKPRSEYQGLTAIRHAVAAGIGVKYFFAIGADHDPATYTTDLEKIRALWNEGKRRFKAYIKGRFLVLDFDRKPGKPDGLVNFYRMFPKETLPAELRNLPDSFPCYVKTPSNGFHLYFKYAGQELKK
jgi:hypothetical protein